MRYANGVLSASCSNKRARWAAAFLYAKRGSWKSRNNFASNPPSIAADLLKQVDAAEEERKWSDNTAPWQARWHLQNWLDCIKTRQRPVADVEIGHRSITVCHLVNIARQAQQKTSLGPRKKLFVGDDEANRYVTRPHARATNCRHSSDYSYVHTSPKHKQGRGNGSPSLALRASVSHSAERPGP